MAITKLIADSITSGAIASTPSFKAYGTTQSIADNSTTVIAYNSETWDTDSDYDNSTYSFTSQVAGKYFVYAIIRV